MNCCDRWTPATVGLPQVSDGETRRLKFARLNYDRGVQLSGVRPLLLPTFFYAGQIQRVGTSLLSGL